MNLSVTFHALATRGRGNIRKLLSCPSGVHFSTLAKDFNNYFGVVLHLPLTGNGVVRHTPRMGLFDYVKLNHPMFGDEQGHTGQCKDFDPYMEEYEINESGRITHTEVIYEDRSDPKAEGLMALAGCTTPVPTGEVTDMNWHGYIWVWGKGDYKWRCKFTDGQLVAAEKVDA